MRFNIDEDGVLTGIENPDSETEVVIPDGVIYIQKSLFRGNDIIKRVVMPDSIMVIREFAFECCSNLSDVVFGKGLVKIKSSAFCECGSLKEIVLPDSIQSIEIAAFSDSGIEKIIMSDRIVNIDFRAFQDTPWQRAQEKNEFVRPCPSVLIRITSQKEKVEIPDGVRYIASYVLDYKNYIQELILPDSVEIIEQFAFCDSGMLCKVHLGNSVRILGNCAFARCYKLKEINIPESVEYWDKSALMDTFWEKQHNCGKMLMLNSHLLIYGDLEAESIELPEGIKEISSSAFENAKAEHIVLPSSLRSLSQLTFYYCNNLRSVFFKEGIERIEGGVFWMCPKLEKVVFPSAVKHIDKAFGIGVNETFVELGFRVKESISEVFFNAQDSERTIYYIAPHISITAMEGQGKQAALGFMKHTVDGGKYDEELIDGYRQYIAENCAKFYGKIRKHPFVLRYMCRERLLPAKDIEKVLDIVKDDVELTALLLEYCAGQNGTDYDI